MLLVVQTLLEQNITRDLFLNPEFLSLLNGTIDSADEAVPFDTPLLCNDYVPKVGTLLPDLRAEASDCVVRLRAQQPLAWYPPQTYVTGLDL